MAINLFSLNQTALRAKAKLGMRVEVAVSFSGGCRFIDDETLQTTPIGFNKIPTTIIGLYKPDASGNRDVMIGWGLTEMYPSNSEHPSAYDRPYDTIVNFGTYQRVKVWSPDIYVVSIVSEATVQVVKVRKSPDGEKCNFCNDFVYMAAPNLPDGKYVCRPCKMSPYSKYNLS